MKLYIRTFGCQMNVHDSSRIVGLMQDAGYTLTEIVKEADVVIINTCSVREKAWHKGISEIGRACWYKREAELIVIAVGCVAEQEGDQWFKKMPALDLVVGPDHYAKLPELIEKIRKSGGRTSATGFDEGRPEDFLALPMQGESKDVSGFVTVMKGCSERCHYCIVPSVRGPERCRPPDDIVEEVTEMARVGIRDVTLLGQKVNAYHYEDTDFADLLVRLDQVPGISRLRFTSSHPRHMTDKLMALFGSLPSLCEYIHLPVQSGSTQVLKRMGRRYTAEAYRETIQTLKKNCNNLAISTDLIVGYPGETEDEFQETMDLIRDVRFANVFSFMYSPRPGTFAAQKRVDDVPEEVKKQRLQRVHDLVSEIEGEIRNELLGRVEEVLIEGVGRNPGQLTGRLRNNLIVNFQAKEGAVLAEAKGRIQMVKIAKLLPHSLEGIGE